MTKNKTRSAKINSLIAQAERSGLEARVEITTSDWCDFISVRIGRPQVTPPTNRLEQIHNYEHVWILASRARGAAAAFKIQAEWRQFTNTSRLRPTHITHAISVMAMP